MTTELSSLSQLIQRRMSALGIKTQADLARVSKLTPQDINRFFGGGTKLPGAEKRRVLANALGVSHLDILVEAGEIRRDELEPIKIQGVVPADPEREELIDKLRRAQLTPQRVRALDGILSMFVDTAGSELVEHGHGVGDTRRS